MNLPATPAAPKKQAPTAATLRQQAPNASKPAAAGPAKPTTPLLTPEEQAKELALIEKGNKWKQDPKLTDQERDLGLYSIKKKEDQAVDRDSKDVAVRDVVQLCHKKPKSKLFTVECVPGDSSTKRPLNRDVLKYTKEDQIAKRGKDYKLKIDYDEIAKSEGGSFSKGYVPWGVRVVVLEENVGTKEKPVMRQIMTMQTTRKWDKHEKKSVIIGDPGRNNKGNRSGVTVGSGVDLGQKQEADYRGALAKAAKNKRFHTPEESTALSDKLKPYMNLTRTDACQYLIKNPLTLTDDDLDFMNYQSFMAHTDDTIDNYEKNTGKSWGDLSKEEQTAIFSYVYQHGSMKSAMYKDFANYDKEKVLADLTGERVHGYMQKFYTDDVGSVRAKAHEAAKQAAALLKATKARAKVVADSVKAIGKTVGN